MNKVVGRITSEESNEIMDLYKKKVALESLIKSVDFENEVLYQKLITDYGSAVLSFNDWWSNKAKQYEWEGDNWFINFETNEISINTK